MLLLNFFLTVLSLLVGISSVGADSLDTLDATPALVAHIQEIQKQTVEMASIVEKWEGDILGAAKIQAASDSIIKAIEEGTETAKNLPKKMKTSQAQDVKRATKKLLKDIKSSLPIITGKKPLFEEAGLTSIMITSIEDTKKAAEGFIGAIIEKVKAGKGIARRLGKKISRAFDSAIAELS